MADIVTTIKVKTPSGYDNLLPRTTPDQAGAVPASHLTSTMPHIFVDGGKTYRWGLAVIGGVVNMVYEEVEE